MVKKSSVPVSVLNKRNNAICYHKVRESQASGTFSVGWILGEYNLAYLFTKTTMTLNIRNGVVETIFYNKAAVIREKDKNQVEGVESKCSSLRLKHK